MKTEYGTICAEAEDSLRACDISLPYPGWRAFLLDYAETSMNYPEDLSRYVHFRFNSRIRDEEL